MGFGCIRVETVGGIPRGSDSAININRRELHSIYPVLFSNKQKSTNQVTKFGRGNNNHKSLATKTIRSVKLEATKHDTTYRGGGQRAHPGTHQNRESLLALAHNDLPKRNSCVYKWQSHRTD